MTFIFLLLIALAIFTIGILFGIYVGARMRENVYHGAMIIEESDKGLVYRLEFAGDPEMLVFEDVIFLKVIPPDYNALIAE